MQREFKVTFPDGNYEYYKTENEEKLRNILDNLGFYVLKVEDRTHEKSPN